MFTSPGAGLEALRALLTLDPLLFYYVSWHPFAFLLLLVSPARQRVINHAKNRQLLDRNLMGEFVQLGPDIFCYI